MMAMECLRKQWNDTCRSAGIMPMSMKTAAQTLAVVYKFDREDITHSPKLKADLDYIQDTYGIRGGMTPDVDFCAEFARYVLEIEKNDDKPTKLAVKLMKDNYNINL